MNIKSIPLAALAATIVATAPSPSPAAVPDVTAVTMTQAANRLVTITYTLTDVPAVVTLDIETNATGDVWASIGGENIQNVDGDVWKQVATGSHTITWRPDLSWPDHKIADGGARAVLTAWALDNTPDYMVVDLAAANTVRYYPGVDFLPGSTPDQKGAVTNNPAYKTSKLLMRKIMASGVEWTMGSADGETQRTAASETAHVVTLTNNYYIGVFEVTQAQWKNIATNSTATANFTVDGDMRPMEKVSYNEIRNAANSTTENTAYYWPNDPNPSSFLGLLRTKTGLDFDLPSETQWEFAARSGHGSGYWGNGSTIENNNIDANLALFGRYQYNGGKIGANSSIAPAATCGATNGTAIVGSYAPNDWGLYDTAGNVWEFCLDWYAYDITAHGGKVNIDPATPANTLSGTSDANRVIHGGSWSDAAPYSRPASRIGFKPTSNKNNNIGFRVACTAGLR